MWHGPYMVKRVLEKGTYELVNYDGTALEEPKNGLYLNKYYASSSAKGDFVYIIVHFA